MGHVWIYQTVATIVNVMIILLEQIVQLGMDARLAGQVKQIMAQDKN